ncbi:MAG: hypothetical protein CAPSK01_002532 [Candidatus Accumulibacter vicinus]|uniref:Uncharacterized protein n=1 Tax=Candidatus Accumulibacter vicinus TaxID=2954382 RepID=A0A084XZP9_9PROT|nr:MAG: hypothetical protein CAPSK01_002532 [Candidatus Accumulibacter vicinus]
MENPDGRVRKPKPLQVGVQISRSIHPEVPTLYEQLRRHLGEVFCKLAERL